MHLKKNSNNGVSSAGFTHNEMQTDAYSSLSFIRSEDSIDWEKTLGVMLLFSNTCPFFWFSGRCVTNSRWRHLWEHDFRCLDSKPDFHVWYFFRASFIVQYISHFVIVCCQSSYSCCSHLSQISSSLFHSYWCIILYTCFIRSTITCLHLTQNCSILMQYSMF